MGVVDGADPLGTGREPQQGEFREGCVENDASSSARFGTVGRAKADDEAVASFTGIVKEFLSGCLY